MSIECAFHGFLAAEPKSHISKAGNNWTSLRVGVGKDDALQWLSVSVFGKAAEVAASLKKSDRVYCEGSIKLDNWRGTDGTERHGLLVASFKLEKTHQIGRNRPKRDGDAKPRSETRANDLNDEIPF